MQTNKKEKRRSIKLDSRFWARVVIAILAFSMLMGTFYYVLLFLAPKAFATEQTETETVDKGNIYMRIGIAYDNKTTCSVRIRADQGIDVGYTMKDRNPITTGFLAQTDVFVSRHVNLKFGSTRYEKASGVSDTVVGSYHIDILSDENYKDDIALLNAAFPEYNAFHAQVTLTHHVFLGQFATAEAAEAALTAIKEAVRASMPPETSETPETSEPTGTTEAPETSEPTGTTEAPETTEDAVTTETSETPESSLLPSDLADAVLASNVRQPLNNDIIIIDPATHKIIWLHCSTTANELFAVAPHQNDPDVRVTMRCSHRTDTGETTRTYDGFLEFNYNSTSSYYGVVVVNIVRLENYIVGVSAAEISTSWPIETIKAFSVAVRSYAIRGINGHGAIGADLCNEACCQVFNGYGPANERVWSAVGETRGIIAVSGRSLCGTFYSSNTGGCTANCTDVWGSSLATYPYLKAVATPWEKYEEYSRGQKTSTVTGTALYQLLENKGYDALTGPVTDIKITKTGNNTTYVTEIKFYDAAGNCQTVTRADKIKKLLTSYVDSANFVVTKSGQSVSRIKYTMLGINANVVNPVQPDGVYVAGNPYTATIFGRQQFTVMTADGVKTFYDSQGDKVMTANGVKDYNMSIALDSQVYPVVYGVNGEVLPDVTQLTPIIETETLTTTAQANSFTFISRGWGHGVGMSQYGIKELGSLGYDYQYILKAYYSGITYSYAKNYVSYLYT